MKKHYFLIGICLLLVFVVINVSSVHATVGGPTHVYNLRTNADASQLMYVELSESGKGCPPIIYSLNIHAGTRTLLVSCDEGIGLNTTNYDVKFRNTLANYPFPLSRIHLPYNSIRAEVSVLQEVKADPNKKIYADQTNFLIDVYERDRKLASFDYIGCKPSQPHVIEGYAIPETDSMALIVSTIGDCFEGGYTAERLFIVPNVNISYSTPLPARTTNTPATADADQNNGNLLVFAGQHIESPIPVETIQPIVSTITETQKNMKVSIYEIVIGLLIFFILLIVYKSQNLTAIILVTMILIGGGIYLYFREKAVEYYSPVACTMDAKLCPDGSYVGRTGPKCEFICPSTNDEMDLNLFIQNKEIAATRDCGATKRVTYRVPRTSAVADASLRMLFSDELHAYGIYKSVNIVNGVARVFLQSDKTASGATLSSLSSCESSHLMSVLRDTLMQYKTISSVELYSPQGMIQF